MDRVRISVGMTLRPRCAECGRAVATFEVDGEQDRLCASCIEGYADTSILTFPQLIALHADEAITESENRALWGDPVTVRWLSPDRDGLAHAYPRKRQERAACGAEPFDERHAWPNRRRCEPCLVVIGAEQMRTARSQPMAVATAPRASAAKPAVRRSRYHEYTYEGVTYPGVTGILKVLDKSDALMSWAARQTAEAALAQLPNLASLAASVGPEGVIRALTARSGWKRDEAAQIGSDIHGYAERVVQGEELEDIADHILTRVTAYVEWWKTSGWKIRLAEAYVISTGMGYGGTFDLLAFDAEGKTVLADVKTGKSVYLETTLQLAAYGMAELVVPVQSPVAYPMPAIDRYVVLHVLDEGVREIEVAVTDEDREAFRSCIGLSAWRKARKDIRL